MRGAWLCLILGIWAGCQSDYCEYAQGDAQSCDAPFDLATCEAATAGCTPDEERALIDFDQCADRVGVGICSTGETEVDGFDALAALASCAEILLDTSVDCFSGAATSSSR